MHRLPSGLGLYIDLDTHVVQDISHVFALAKRWNSTQWCSLAYEQEKPGPGWYVDNQTHGPWYHPYVPPAPSSALRARPCNAGSAGPDVLDCGTWCAATV